MKAVVAAFNQEKALVGAFSVITNLRICFGWNFLKHYYTGLTRSSATMRTMCGGLQWAGGSSSSVSTRGAAGAAIVH